MELFKYSRRFYFMKRSKIALAISLTLIAISYLLLATKGLNYGIDFAGGTIVQVKYQGEAPIAKMRQALQKDPLFKNVTITRFGSADEVIIRMKSVAEDVRKSIGETVSNALKSTGTYQIRRVDEVGPQVGSELREKGILSFVIAIAGILIYVAFRFEWRFAVASVLALVHDVSISLGAVSLMHIDFNLDVLAAVLTLLGYSLNDTIIVFDRIREGIMTTKNDELDHVIDDSITRTLSRTVLTSLTTFLVVLTLFLFGGEIIKPFSFTMLVGIVVGTYSSIFIASPILLWFKFDIKGYRSRLAQKAKRSAEKERMRAQYEGGTV
jgi:preprotein translocase subunit SecF